ncbi:hypothetical protein [Gimesia chilikensis]|uniref:hypothetical protein n=1 Tax=Gimesia chilikensis TaxID=2605989 RepID=UPI003A93E964
MFNFYFFASSLEIEFGKTFPGIMLRSGRAFLGLVWAKHLTKEGPMPFISSSRVNAASFSLFRRSMMQADIPPLTEVINDQRWRAACHDIPYKFARVLDTLIPLYDEDLFPRAP